MSETPNDPATTELLAALDALYPLPIARRRKERAIQTAEALARWMRAQFAALENQIPALLDSSRKPQGLTPRTDAMSEIPRALEVEEKANRLFHYHKGSGIFALITRPELCIFARECYALGEQAAREKDTCGAEMCACGHFQCAHNDAMYRGVPTCADCDCKGFTAALRPPVQGDE